MHGLPKGSDGSRTVGRALTLLDFFTAENSVWGLSELSRASGLDKATTMRLLRTLEAAGVVAGDSGRYVMGPKVLQWAEALGSAAQLKTRAVPFVDELWRQTNETVTLVAVSGDFRVTILERESAQPVRRVVDMFVPLPLYCGAAGKAILATMSDDELDAYLARVPLEPLTPFTIVRTGALRKELAIVRARGYATSTRERIPEGAGLAAAVPAQAGRAVAALAISLPAYRFDEKLVARWARLLSRAAGALGSPPKRSRLTKRRSGG